MDGGVGAVIGGFEPAVWTVLRVRPVMEAAVGEGAAQALVEEEEEEGDLDESNKPNIVIEARGDQAAAKRSTTRWMAVSAR